MPPDALDFNPLPPRGGRRTARRKHARSTSFQPTPSSRRETASAATRARSLTFQPTPSSRRETSCGCAYRNIAIISTHSLLAEGDPARAAPDHGRAISTHSLLAEGDADFICKQLNVTVFQPTPSSRRETLALMRQVVRLCISTHSLLAEGDLAGGRQYEMPF